MAVAAAQRTAVEPSAAAAVAAQRTAVEPSAVAVGTALDCQGVRQHFCSNQTWVCKSQRKRRRKEGR